MATKKKAERIQRVAEHITPEDLPTFYVNNVEITVTPWDINLLLCQIVGADEKKVTFQNLARVIFSPQHAKAVATVLSRNVAIYEEKYGPIPDFPV